MAERLRALRRARRLTQIQLAELAGVHRTTIGEIERGGRLPQHRVARRIAAALRVRVADVAEFANGDSDEAVAGPAPGPTD